MRVSHFPPYELTWDDWALFLFIIAGLAAFVCQWRMPVSNWRQAFVVMGLWTIGFVAVLIVVQGKDLNRQVPVWSENVSVLGLVLPVCGFFLALCRGWKFFSRWTREELTIVVGVLVVCGGYFLMQPSSAPTSIARLQCRDNLTKLAIALHAFHDKARFLPAAAAGQPPVSWRVQLLPYLGYGNLYERYHLDTPWNQPPNSALQDVFVPDYCCPLHQPMRNQQGDVFTSYVAITGKHAILDQDVSQSFGKIPDGTTNTILLAEACGLQIPWMEPRDFELGIGAVGVNLIGQRKRDSTGAVSSYHPHGGFVAMADGSVRFLTNQTDPNVLKALLTADGGETIPMD